MLVFGDVLSGGGGCYRQSEYRVIYRVPSEDRADG